MERRNRSLEALNKLYYIDSLDDYDKAVALEYWVGKYLNQDFEKNLDLELKDLNILLELFYKNINFLKGHSNTLKQEIENHDNIKKFFT